MIDAFTWALLAAGACVGFVGVLAIIDIYITGTRKHK